MVATAVTVEMIAILAAIAVPIVTLLAIAGLIRGVGELERSRDELVELQVQGKP